MQYQVVRQKKRENSHSQPLTSLPHSSCFSPTKPPICLRHVWSLLYELCICSPPSLECPWLQHILCQILPCSFCYCCCPVTKLWPHGLQHAKVPSLPLFPGVCSNSCPLSWWCCLIISSSATLFSFCLQSFAASGSFPVSWLFASGGKSIGALVSPSVLPVNTQGWFPLGLTLGLLSLLSKGLLKSLLQHHKLKVSILQHLAFFMVQLSYPYMTTVEKP